MSDVTFDLGATNTMEVHQRRAEPWRVTLVDTGEDDDDRRPASARARATSATRRSASPTATASRTSTSTRADRRSTRRSGQLATVTACSRRAASARWTLDGDRGQRRFARSRGRRRLDQRRLLRAVARGARLHRRRRHRSGSRSRWSASRATASSAPIATTASGSRWTRCATSASSKSSGAPATRAVEDVVTLRRRASGGTGASSSPGTRASRARGCCSGWRGWAPRSPALALCRRRPRPSLFDAAALERRSAIAARRRARPRRGRRACRRGRARGRRSTSRRRRSCGRSYAIRSRPTRPTCMGTVNVLEAVRATPSVRAVVVRHHRQVLREPRVAVALPRGRRRWAAHDPYSS